MSATLILHCREALIGFTGDTVTEPDPDRAGLTKPVAVGRFLAQFVASGKGRPEADLPRCQSLALDLWSKETIELGNSDVSLILACLKKAHADGAVNAWVVGHFQYLLDPAGISPEIREKMAEHYLLKKPVVTAAVETKQSS